jgi:hypothetical protein
MIREPASTAIAWHIGVASLGEMEQLGPHEALVRALSMSYRRWGAQQPEAESATAGDQPLDKPPPPVEWRAIRVVLGEVIELDAVAHVVYRTILQSEGHAEAVEPVAILSLRLTPEGWRVQSTDLLGVAFGRTTNSSQRAWFLRRRGRAR